MAKGYISEVMGAGRVLSHAKIAELPFKFNSANTFSVFIVPKANVTAGVISAPDNTGILLNCKCYMDDNASNLPVIFNQWGEAAITEIPAEAIDLATYDVYWGAGADVSES